MNCDQLPRATTTANGVALRCPWCRGDVDEAKFTLLDLLLAHEQRLLHAWLKIDETGRPKDGSLTTSCPSCERLFAIALSSSDGDRRMRCIPIRSERDARWLAGERP